MKKSLLSILIAVFLISPPATTLWGQTPCQLGFLQLYTQEAVDSFPALFPACTEFAGSIRISGDKINNLDSFYIIENLIGHIVVYASGLTDLNGLQKLNHIDLLTIDNNSELISLNGLENLKSIRVLNIRFNDALNDVSALDRPLDSLQGFTIRFNPELNHCSIFPLCAYYAANCLFGGKCSIFLEANGEECESLEAFVVTCGIDEIQLELQTFIADSIDCSNTLLEINHPTIGAKIHYGNYGFTIPLTHFKQFPLFNIQSEFITIIPNKFAIDNWELCQDTIVIDPLQFGDTIYAEILLKPLIQCPELTVDLGLPPTFRGCLVSSDMRVRTQNTGTIPAENVELAVVIPFDLIEVESAVPPPVAQSGDTLFFALGDLDIFQVSDVHLTVRTRCDTFLLGHTICIEAFAEMDNPCPPDMSLGSRVQVRASCQNDEKVVFTLTNTGDAPTDVPHHYFIIEDEVVLLSDEFQLNVLESIQVEVDASGATMRMEATKLPNGLLTAAALEGCGGFTPGMINAFWLDRGESHYDIACRPVILAYDPNDKLAIPSGVGPAHLLAPNRPIEYIIRFQNTGTDTAFRVLLTDILPPELDINTFRPGYASHDYTWEIRGLDTLDVLFFPIALPDSAASQEGSQGFFTFSMNQKPDLPHGTLIRNTASIIFDFNPPIVTNTVFHTIGELTVSINQPQPHIELWQLRGNPMSDHAAFWSPVAIPGSKRFELYDLMGRALRQEVFMGDEFVFQRGTLRNGIYFFRIVDGQGRLFTGKIMIAE